ncbi:MAG TPA: hypothetical protein VFD17_02245 [Clostridia bacterium]|nr:hypothetical protein [Clostridia bacterium]
MDIGKLKRWADKEMLSKEKIKSKQAKAIIEFERLFEVADENYILWNGKIKKWLVSLLQIFVNILIRMVLMWNSKINSAVMVRLPRLMPPTKIWNLNCPV